MIYDDNARAVYVISVAAEIVGMHPQTLRMYERVGLVAPSRSQGGNRRYSEVDVARLRRIQELTAEGLNLAGVQRVLELEATVEALQQQVDSLLEEREQMNRRYRRDLVPVSKAGFPFPTHKPRI